MLSLVEIAQIVGAIQMSCHMLPEDIKKVCSNTHTTLKKLLEISKNTLSIYELNTQELKLIYVSSVKVGVSPKILKKLERLKSYK